MAQVFISYSRKDLSFVEQLAADLKEAGFDVWYDLSNIRGGSHWTFEIEKALKNSQFAVFVLSPDSIVSEWVQREFLFANNRNMTIVPLMYRSCELSLSFLDLNYIDVQGSNYRQNFDEILEALSEQQEPSSTGSESRKSPEPLPSKKSLKITPAFYGVALIVVAILIGGGLLVKNYFSPPSQDAASTFTPTMTITSTSTFTPIPTFPPTAVAPSLTPIPIHTPSLSNDFVIVFESEINQNRNVLEINPVSGATQALLAESYHEKSGVWSPKGQMLAFESNRDGTRFQIFLYMPNGSTGQKIRQLTDSPSCSNWAPAWSPDGTKIVFYSDCENAQRDIFVMNRDGLGRRNLTNSRDQDRYPVWSPDGKMIAFSSFRDNKSQIVVMNANGTEPRTIADGCQPAFSPDNWIWFSSQCDKEGDIKRIQIDGSNPETFVDVFGYAPAVSPDGNYVAFQSGGDICIMSVDGSYHKCWEAMGAYEGSVSWKP